MNAEMKIKLCTFEKLKPFMCNQCDSKFSKKSHLIRHSQDVHEKLKPIKCDLCDYKCARNAHLIKHVSGVHENLKPYSSLHN